MKVKVDFFICEHHAERARLHWDIRFERPNDPKHLWLSYASRKEPPTKTGERNLIVKTTLHTKEDALFVGEIKEGYGKGILKKWDSGHAYILVFHPRHVAIEFHGSKLNGLYHIISMGNVDRDFKSQKYLFFKGKM